MPLINGHVLPLVRLHTLAIVTGIIRSTQGDQRAVYPQMQTPFTLFTSPSFPRPIAVFAIGLCPLKVSQYLELLQGLLSILPLPYCLKKKYHPILKRLACYHFSVNVP